MNRYFFHLSVVASLFGASLQTIAETTTAQVTQITSPHGELSQKIEAIQSPWSMSYWGVLNANRPRIDEIQRKAYNEGDTKFLNYGYLSLKYNLNKEENISLRTPFLYLSVGYGEKKYVPLDLFVAYSQSNIAEIAGAKIASSYRLYLPTSQEAFDSKRILGVRTEFSAKKFVDSWRFSYYFKPDFYIYEQNEFADSSRGNSIQPSKMVKLEHYVEVEKPISQHFGIRPYLGFEDTWYNAADKKTQSNHKTDLIARLGLDIAISRKLNFGLGVENKTSIVNRKTDWVPLSPEDNGLFLVTYAEI